MKNSVCYIYCYNCNVVLGKPDFTLKSVKKDAKRNHKGHIFSQNEWDIKIAESDNGSPTRSERENLGSNPSTAT